MRSKRSRKRGRRPNVRRGHWRREEDFEETDIDVYRRQAMSGKDPIALFQWASISMYVSEPRRKHHFAAIDRTPIDRAEAVASLLLNTTRRSTVMLAMLAEFLVSDDALVTSIRAELATRPPLRPYWLAHLDDTELQRAVRLSDVLDEVDTVLIQFWVPTRGAFTCVVKLDLHFNDLARQIRVVDKPIDDVLTTVEASSAAFRCVDLELADVGARLTEAVKFEYMLLQRDSSPWPEYGALLEWLVSLLPEGGWKYPRPALEEGVVDDLIGRFFDSPHGAAFSRRHHDDRLRNLVMFGIECHAGDPLRWSERRAEEFLFDHLRECWDPEDLAAGPFLLRAFIRFAHDEVGIRRELTDDVLAAIDGWQLRYQEQVRRLLADEDDCA